jgi:hypothetical protein
VHNLPLSIKQRKSHPFTPPHTLTRTEEATVLLATPIGQRKTDRHMEVGRGFFSLSLRLFLLFMLLWLQTV